MNKVKACVIFLLGAMSAAACVQTSTNTPTPSNAPTASNAQSPGVSTTPPASASVASGKDLYAKNCAACHKESGKGGKLTLDGKTLDPDDVTTARMKAKTDDKFYEYISEGFPDDGMPAYKDKLSPDEIKAIVAHVRTLQGS